ncbi:MAG: PHP domain-containing protein [Chloroflexi bacterium]|nr:PHP domain-containing protein [Chloroflexota bacterium]
MTRGTPHPGKADLHLHTTVSDGMASVAELLGYVQHHTDLDVVAVTDHDDLRGGLAARELAARRDYRFEVVVGMEVTTLGGHLLALFLDRPVPSLRPLDATIDAVLEQGGLCVVPHPMAWIVPSVGRRSLDRLAAESGRRRVQAIEACNGSVPGKFGERRAQERNRRLWRLPEVGGSDAHFLAHVGASVTRFPGRTAADLRQAIADGTTSAERVDSADRLAIPLRERAIQHLRWMVLFPARRAGRVAMGLGR